jgi:hypothetical protein
VLRDPEFLGWEDRLLCTLEPLGSNLHCIICMCIFLSQILLSLPYVRCTLLSLPEKNGTFQVELISYIDYV